MFGFLTTLLTKLGALSAVTQAAAGVTIAVAGVGGVAAAGGLPAPVQDSLTSVVSSITGTPSADTSSTDGTSSTDTVSPTDTASPVDATSPADATDTSTASTAPLPSLPPQAAFGQSVARAARSGGVDGATVGAAARSAHQPAQAAAHKPTQPPASTTDSAAPVSGAAPHGKPSARRH